MMNTTISTIYPLKNTAININDIIRDAASQIDHNVAVCTMLILGFFIMSRIVLPIAMAGWRGYLESDILDKIAHYFNSLTETLMLGGAVFISYVAFVQGDLFVRKTTIVYSLFLILAVFYRIGEYFKDVKTGKKKAFSKRFRDALDELRGGL